MQADAVCTSGSYQMQRIKKGRRDVPAGLHWRIGLDKSKLFPVGCWRIKVSGEFISLPDVDHL